jgi:hypothetical protein
MPVVRNGVEAYRSDQLVVEREYTGMVQEGLRRLGIAASELDSSAPLSLTLLGLSGADTAAALLRQDSALVAAAIAAQQAAGRTAATISDLDLILSDLRQWLRDGNDGWLVTIGKNRILDRVQGSPYIKGGVGEPDPTAPLSLPPVAQQTGARVAVLDTQLFAHPDLIGRFLGDSTAAFSTEPRATQGHSTFVAGLIAQRAPTAQLILHTVLTTTAPTRVPGTSPPRWPAPQMPG